jgi:hypothetical protein
MLALDRGAMELRTTSVPSDVLMTPDLRFTFSEPGPLDLRIRVTRNGDTCVENRVAGLTNHPILHVNSLFGDEGYEVLPGQHVLFERANLHEVVDNESSPCGCPEESAKPAPAEVGAISLKPVPRVSSAQAAAQHPFPAAVSQGLAPPPEVPPTVVHTQIATTLVYPAVPPDSSGKSASAPAKPATTPKPATPAKPGFFRGIGRFFKRIF